MKRNTRKLDGFRSLKKTAADREGFFQRGGVGTNVKPIGDWGVDEKCAFL